MDKYERFELEQKRTEPRSLAEWIEVVKVLGEIALWYIAYLAIAVAVLYGIVRFVKWAWYQWASP
jgi:hypothetical protein